MSKQGRDLCYQMSYLDSFLCSVTLIKMRGFLMNLKIDYAAVRLFWTFIKCRFSCSLISLGNSEILNQSEISLEVFKCILVTLLIECL